MSERGRERMFRDSTYEERLASHERLQQDAKRHAEGLRRMLKTHESLILETSAPTQPRDAQGERWPFDPPYTHDDLPQLDRLHAAIGLGPFWMESERRAEIESGW